MPQLIILAMGVLVFSCATSESHEIDHTVAFPTCEDDLAVLTIEESTSECISVTVPGTGTAECPPDTYPADGTLRVGEPGDDHFGSPILLVNNSSGTVSFGIGGGTSATSCFLLSAPSRGEPCGLCVGGACGSTSGGGGGFIGSALDPHSTGRLFGPTRTEPYEAYLCPHDIRFPL